MEFKGTFPYVICSKVRNGDTREVTVKEGDCREKHVFIVDDLVRSGGTLLSCREVLKAAGASKVSCFVTHACFSEDGHTRFLGREIFEKFYVTDSCPLVTNKLVGQDPFEVISLSSSIAKILRESRSYSH
eukprot:TRINITY_DN5544_c0_g1_i19.p2 TRINITY_DN5544_c0_g1~~TRINITY_DN5544_c0_g1_i19.p2  ORF type:complete len:130 (-),score=23.33 TRINITY_DN5544_c0_g1_i19:329-718(-)